MSHRDGNDEPVSGNLRVCTRGILSLCRTFQLVENGMYSIGWTLLDVLEFYVAAVSETRDFSLDR